VVGGGFGGRYVMLVRQSPDSCNDLIAWQSGPSVNQRPRRKQFNTNILIGSVLVCTNTTLRFSYYHH
jgi:hypothetical protein